MKEDLNSGHKKKMIDLNIYKDKIEAIRERAASIHSSVNQWYDKVHPYSFHLCAVADCVMEHLEDEMPEEDILPVIFGAYFHDSIEDARLSYNDVRRIALDYMDERQALVAAEIVYALTNDKGRTRAERAGEKYYSGIRTTPYASFVKMADRFANMSYSVRNGQRMAEVYRSEMPHFLESVVVGGTVPGSWYHVPASLLEAVGYVSWIRR